MTANPLPLSRSLRERNDLALLGLMDGPRGAAKHSKARFSPAIIPGMGADVLGVVALIAFLGIPLLVLMWLERRKRRRRGENVPAIVVAGRGTGQTAAATVEGLAGYLGGLAGCLFFLVFALAGLFVLVWIVKQMWEAA